MTALDPDARGDGRLLDGRCAREGASANRRGADRAPGHGRGNGDQAFLGRLAPYFERACFRSLTP
jgi:hypothetical protein